MEIGDQQELLKGKSLEGQLLWELEHGFELSPRESELIVDEVRQYYAGKSDVRTGRVSLWVVRQDASVGKPLSELPKIEVVVTLDGGIEDLEAYRLYGHTGLRRQKLLRVSEEIVDQGGIGTQEDLRRLLGTSLRTIRRDIAYFRNQGIRVFTRGVYSDIGPSTSHKVVIVEMFLSGCVYSDICRRTRHSAKAVKRYVGTFTRVIALYHRGIKEPEEVARYAGISSRLAAEYLELYFRFGKEAGFVDRIQELLAQRSSRPDYPGTRMKKKGLAEVGR